MQNDTFHFSDFFGGNAARLAAENDRLRDIETTTLMEQEVLPA